jgi:hypothetical protein
LESSEFPPPFSHSLKSPILAGAGWAAARLIKSAKRVKPRKLQMSDNPAVEKGSSVRSGDQDQIQTYRHVVITVLMRREDYESFKKQGGPRSDQISMALRHYLKLIAETKWRPEMSDTANRTRRFTTFQCTVSKDLWDDIRNLRGRVDSHTVEAIRLWLL